MLDVACWKLKGKSLLGVAYPRRASWARKRPVPSALGKSNLFWTCSSCTPAKNSRKTAETHRNTKSSLDFRPKNCQQANKHAPKSVRDDLKGKHHKYQKQQVINLYKLLTSDPSCILLAYFLELSRLWKFAKSLLSTSSAAQGSQNCVEPPAPPRWRTRSKTSTRNDSERIELIFLIFLQLGQLIELRLQRFSKLQQASLTISVSLSLGLLLKQVLASRNHSEPFLTELQHSKEAWIQWRFLMKFAGHCVKPVSADDWQCLSLSSPAVPAETWENSALPRTWLFSAGLRRAQTR